MKISICILLISIMFTTPGLASDRPPWSNPDGDLDYNSCHGNTTSIVMGVASVIGGILSPMAGVFMGGATVVIAGDGLGKCKCMPRPMPGSTEMNPPVVMICTVGAEHLCGDWGIGTSCCWVENSVHECKPGGGEQ
jgi:hypothetical protein